MNTFHDAFPQSKAITHTFAPFSVRALVTREGRKVNHSVKDLSCIEYGGCRSATTDFELGHGFVVQDKLGALGVEPSLGCKNDVNVISLTCKLTEVA
jgi:hypothetical protein